MSKEDKIVITHIGKKAPKGFKEIEGSVHLGNGIWILRCEKEVLTAYENPTKSKEIG